MIYAIGILIWGLSLGFLEYWFKVSPDEVRRFTFETMQNMPVDLARWIFQNMENIDQFAHILLFLISLAIGLGVEVILFAGVAIGKSKLQEL